MGCLYPVSLRSRPMASCPHNTARNARKHCSPLPPPALLDSSIPPSFPWPNLYCPWWKPCQGSRLGRCLKGTTGCEQTWGRRGQTAESGDDEEATDWKEPDDKSWGKSDKWKLTRAEYQGNFFLFQYVILCRIWLKEFSFLRTELRSLSNSKPILRCTLAFLRPTLWNEVASSIVPIELDPKPFFSDQFRSVYLANLLLFLAALFFQLTSAHLC